VKADNFIRIAGDISVIGFGDVNWQAENQFEVFGTLTVGNGAEVNIVAADCN